MVGHWVALIFPVLASLVTPGIEAAYHEPSKEIFQAPTSVTKGSLFGYSIAYEPQTRSLVASAPKYRTGAIYKCRIGVSICDQIEVNGTEGYKYGDMWLGATVAAGSNFTMACAPRYIEFRYPEVNNSKIGTFGRCYSSPSSMKMTDLPTVTPETLLNPYEKNMESFGWSINVDRHNSITVGGPAMDRGRVMFYKQISDEPILLRTPFYKIYGMIVNFNYGYSVTSGNFISSNTDDIHYAISSPYGEIGHGVVILTDLIIEKLLAPPRLYRPLVGALFGAALASANLRLPGQRQALLVGAPGYAQKGGVDQGAVYIYLYDLSAQAVLHQKTILGKKDKGQFGAAIISLGDLNGDLRDEIAVSAPYEDDGKGAVYVYSGGHLVSDTADSLLKPLQRIQAGFQGFGRSLTALQDYDGNGCNELAIGAPYSDVFVIYRCLQQMTVTVQTLRPRGPRARRNDTYYEFEACMDFKFPPKQKTVKTDIFFKLIISHKVAELVNSDGEKKYIERTVQIRDTKPKYCMNVGILIQKVIGYEPSIQYQITAKQLNSPMKDAKFDSSRLLVSELSVLSVADTVWAADCGDKTDCKPDFNLSIQTSIKDNYKIGSSDTETISFTSFNSGDVAYRPCAQVNLQGVRVNRWPSTCSLWDETLVCLPRQPVEKNAVWQSDPIELDMKSLKSKDKSISVSIWVHPVCGPKEIRVEEVRTFTLYPDDTGVILSRSTEDIIELTNEELENTGKQTSHVYTVYNNGITVWVNLTCKIVIQSKYFYNDISVTVDSEAPYQCGEFTNTTDFYTATCVVTELLKQHKFDVIIPISIEPGSIDPDYLEKDSKTKLNVSSQMKLMYDDKQQTSSIVSTLKMKEAVLPIWIIIIAALVGLLIIVIIAFVLYECGFLRRKNKEKLKNLRKSVHRQSVRRSMVLRESMRSSASAERRSGDRERLIETNGANTSPNDIEDQKKDTELPKKDINVIKNGAERNSDLADKDADNSDSNLPKKEPAECILVKKEEIIRGLQKNLVQNSSLTHLAITAKKNQDAPMNTEF